MSNTHLLGLHTVPGRPAAASGRRASPRHGVHAGWPSGAATRPSSVRQWLAAWRDRRRVTLSSGNGTSADRPIIVKAAGGLAGAEARYRLLSARFGQMDHDWTVARRVHQTNARGRIIEKFLIARPKASNEVVYFDITDHYGRP